MRRFNQKLAGYLDETFLARVSNEMKKPQSMRAAAKKLDVSVYAMKRLNEYYNSLNHLTNEVVNECRNTN
jgi:hypothetical protein